ncbi:hypothetical protein OC844_007662 [Tilletia horrida]|nr:hypothetical protein OC844_007662 [Tilletia horrida]
MLPSYPPPSTSASSSAARLGAPAAQHGAAGGQGAVPPACLKAVVRPGHSVNLHLFAHPPTQPLALGSHTAYLTPTALVNSITSDNNPATSSSSSSSSSAADSARKRPPAEYPHGHRTLTLVLGQTTTQDVLAELGAPQRRFGKVDERLGIHSFAAAASAAAAAAALSSVGGSGRRTDGNAVELARGRMWKAGAALGADGAEFEEGEAMDEVHDNPEFWNYFDLGIDLLFATPALTPAAVASSGGGNANGAQSVQPGLGKGAGAGGVLLKVIVHSNVPGSALFQRFHRCPWVVVPAVPSSSVGSGAGKRKAEVTRLEQA